MSVDFDGRPEPMKRAPRSVTLDEERDSEGKMWIVIRCVCHAYRYSRRPTWNEARRLCKEQGWTEA